jgi:cytidylate kinase
MKHIITIGREFGSGGRELGKRLSDELGFAYYDQEIIAEIAKRTDMSEEYVSRICESKPGMAFPIHVRQSFYAVPNPVLQQSITIYAEQHKLLRELAQKSDCIIVGRCADYILKDFDPFRVFVYADTESKLKRCMERKAENENLTEAQMKKKMAEIDKGRAKYYEFFSEHKWGEREYYDLLVNTSGVDIKKLATSLSEYLKTLFE